MTTNSFSQKFFDMTAVGGADLSFLIMVVRISAGLRSRRIFLEPLIRKGPEAYLTTPLPYRIVTSIRISD